MWLHPAAHLRHHYPHEESKLSPNYDLVAQCGFLGFVRLGESALLFVRLIQPRAPSLPPAEAFQLLSCFFLRLKGYLHCPLDVSQGRSIVVLVHCSCLVCFSTAREGPLN
jgi:hypothetical protein